MAVRRAVKRGEIEKVEKCIRCGQGPTEAHHYRGYARKFWLYVLWLCRSCHRLDHTSGLTGKA